MSLSSLYTSMYLNIGVCIHHTYTVLVFIHVCSHLSPPPPPRSKKRKGNKNVDLASMWVHALYSLHTHSHVHTCMSAHVIIMDQKDGSLVKALALQACNLSLSPRTYVKNIQLHASVISVFLRQHRRKRQENHGEALRLATLE